MDKSLQGDKHSRVSATRLWLYYKRAKGYDPSTCGLGSHRFITKAIALAIVHINSWLTKVNDKPKKIAYIYLVNLTHIGQNDSIY